VSKRNEALRECRCLTCGELIDGATSVTEIKATPDVGDFSLCAYCSTIMVFVGPKDQMSLRLPNIDELMEALELVGI
jgi:hypothetical protein